VGETPSENEIERQYGVLRLRLSAHSRMRDTNAFASRLAEVILIVCAVVFCATTFAGDRLYESLGVEPATARLLIGLASVATFASSLAILVLDWKGNAARHGDSAKKWAVVLEEYRKRRREDGTWPEETRAALSTAYWEADRNSVEIPDRAFNRHKSRYLRKVEISKLISKYPGCPRPALWVLLRTRDTIKALLAGGEPD